MMFLGKITFVSILKIDFDDIMFKIEIITLWDLAFEVTQIV